MQREQESHFSTLPRLERVQRSTFNREFRNGTTINTGELVPFMWTEVLPGDTASAATASAIQMTTPIFPVMDNAFADFYFFFVPNRIIWKHWKEFCGENNSTYWTQPTTYTVPMVKAPANGWKEMTLADYLGIPTKKPASGTADEVSALPFRAYCKIYNEWFRDQNVQQPLNCPDDDTTITGANGANQITDCIRGGYPAKVNKFHDYFTSCLPGAQKGKDVDLPIGSLSGKFPVFAEESHKLPVDGTAKALNWSFKNPTSGRWSDWENGSDGWVVGVKGSANGGETWRGVENQGHSPNLAYQQITPNNLWAMVDGASSSATTINQLREAIAVQHFLEDMALGGSRYREVIRSCFGVIPSDKTMQIPQYLGGKRVNINMQRVLQTSETGTKSPQGNAAGQSYTTSRDDMFNMSFEEHGILMGLVCVRTDHTYQQGLNRAWKRKNLTDFYWPELANIGEQPVMKSEIYWTGQPDDESVFGYQEAWADYRYGTTIVTGKMRANADGTLSAWNYADNYATAPTLSAGWLAETRENVKRTLAVQTEPDFICDFFTVIKTTRVMPIYSVPGLNRI